MKRHAPIFVSLSLAQVPTEVASGQETGARRNSRGAEQPGLSQRREERGGGLGQGTGGRRGEAISNIQYSNPMSKWGQEAVASRLGIERRESRVGSRESGVAR